MTSELRRSWLRHWHSVIDQSVGQDPSFDFEATFQDPYGDFRMHFVTWDLSDENLGRCFDVLPRGAEMCRRAIEMGSLCRAGKQAMPEPKALELFQRGLDGFVRFVECEDLKKPIRTVRGTSAKIHSQLTSCDRVAVLFEEVDWDPPLDADALEARPFLRETLYRLAHSYDVADYIDWPLFRDPQSIDPHRSFALLALSGVYFPMLDADGPVLFVVNDGV